MRATRPGAENFYGACADYDAGGRTIEQKRRAVKRLTDVLREELNANPERLTVAFVEVPRDSYARNGLLLSERTDVQ